MSERYIFLPLLLSLFLLWLATGTLSPYAVSFYYQVVSPDCGYPFNIDHSSFSETFYFLQGYPVDKTINLVTLKRITYPLLAFPLMSAFGFIWGGFLTNLLIHSATFLWFVKYIRVRIGLEASQAAAWLLCTYPGIAYWVGMPYMYMSVVPCSLIVGAGLVAIYEGQSTTKRILICFLMGILCLTYDLMLGVVGIALALEMIWLRRKFLELFFGLLAFVLPYLSWSAALNYFFEIPAKTHDYDMLALILRSYFSTPDIGELLMRLQNTFITFIHHFFFVNFCFISIGLLFFTCLLLKARNQQLVPSGGLKVALCCYSLGLLALFLFCNLAPPYEYMFNFRGPTYARFYQQSIFIFLVILVFQYQRVCLLPTMRAIATCTLALVVGLNALIILSPWLNITFADVYYFNFHRHAQPHTYSENVTKYGLYPLGFCSRKIALDEKVLTTRN